MTIFTDRLYDGKRILVTGGTSGIGAGLCSAFADHGGQVDAIGLPAPDPATEPAHDRVTVHHLDVTDRPAVETHLAGTGPFDVLVNCAGIALPDGREHTLEGWDKVIGINLSATMALCTVARSALAERNGSIINIASMYATFGSALNPAYSASKGGIVQLTKSLARAFAPDGIRVNAVAPGWIVTPLGAGIRDDPAANDGIVARIPLGDWGYPADVASAILFLASDAASYITGAILPVDGGYLTVGAF